MDNRSDFQQRIGVGERQHLYGRHVGKTKTIPVRRDDNGEIGGVQVEHWSGRVDATVFAGPVNTRTSTNAE